MKFLFSPLNQISFLMQSAEFFLFFSYFPDPFLFFPFIKKMKGNKYGGLSNKKIITQSKEKR